MISMYSSLVMYGLAALILLIVLTLAFWGGQNNGYQKAYDEYEDELEKMHNVVLKQITATHELESAVRPHIENSQRYQLVRYYLENDHGGLAINAFYGPGALTTADELDLQLDEDLDQYYSAVEKDSFKTLMDNLGKAQ